jgi:tRNA(Ile)-lysidine synthetase-like protein
VDIVNFEVIKLSNVACLDADKLQYPLTLRRWQKGDWFIPFGMKGRKKLSDFFADKKMNLIDKEQVWLLASGDDIVWVYIANETSPIQTYSEMIPNIKGIHYRVNSEQWSYLTQKMFDIDGIPSYVVVDKDGKYSQRDDFINHVMMVETLEKMINK